MITLLKKCKRSSIFIIFEELFLQICLDIVYYLLKIDAVHWDNLGGALVPSCAQIQNTKKNPLAEVHSCGSLSVVSLFTCFECEVHKQNVKENDKIIIMRFTSWYVLRFTNAPMWSALHILAWKKFMSDKGNYAVHLSVWWSAVFSLKQCVSLSGAVHTTIWVSKNQNVRISVI